MTVEDRAELLTQVAGFSPAEVEDVERVLEMIPSLTVEVTCETEGEEGIQEGDSMTFQAWITIKRGNGLIGALPHATNFPFHKEENFWFLLGDSASNSVWFSQKVSFMDEDAATTAASNTIQEIMEVSGASAKETSEEVKKAVEKTLKRTGADTRSGHVSEGPLVEDRNEEEEEDEEEEYDDYESEYSEDEEDEKDIKKKGTVANGKVHKKASSSEGSGTDEE